jgi:hypothetical protein
MNVIRADIATLASQTKQLRLKFNITFTSKGELWEAFGPMWAEKSETDNCGC